MPNELKPNLIEEWEIGNYGGAYVIYGNIFNDEKHRFADGTPIHTSRLKSVDFVEGVAHTKNSTYNLGRRANDEIYT
jgi:hypothetical protein